MCKMCLIHRTERVFSFDPGSRFTYLDHRGLHYVGVGEQTVYLDGHNEAQNTLFI